MTSFFEGSESGSAFLASFMMSLGLREAAGAVASKKAGVADTVTTLGLCDGELSHRYRCIAELRDGLLSLPPNQTLERNAIALHFLFSDAAHGVAHL